MRQSYSEKPEATWLEVLNEVQGGACIVHLNENIEEETAADADGNEEITYTANHYAIETTYRESLLEAVTANRAAWLDTAVKAEEAGDSKTALEVLQESVAELQTANEEMSSAIDELTIAILEGVM